MVRDFQCPALLGEPDLRRWRRPALFRTVPCWLWAPGSPGGQITEDLMAAGRQVHLSVSACPEAPPRRRRGPDTFYWIPQINLHGPAYSIHGLQIGQLPSPAAIFMCNPLVSGNVAATASSCGNWAATACGFTAALRELTTAYWPSATTSLDG